MPLRSRRPSKTPHQPRHSQYHNLPLQTNKHTTHHKQILPQVYTQHPQGRHNHAHHIFTPYNHTLHIRRTLQGNKITIKVSSRQGHPARQKSSPNKTNITHLLNHQNHKRHHPKEHQVHLTRTQYVNKQTDITFPQTLLTQTFHHTIKYRLPFDPRTNRERPQTPMWAKNFNPRIQLIFNAIPFLIPHHNTRTRKRYPTYSNIRPHTSNKEHVKQEQAHQAKQHFLRQHCNKHK